jgi:hypothetical protein
MIIDKGLVGNRQVIIDIDKKGELSFEDKALGAGSKPVAVKIRRAKVGKR